MSKNKDKDAAEAPVAEAVKVQAPSKKRIVAISDFLWYKKGEEIKSSDASATVDNIAKWKAEKLVDEL